MSLVQHVSAVEGIDRERDEGLDVASLILTKTLSHKLSYDLLPAHVEHVPEKIDSVGAYNFSTFRRFGKSRSISVRIHANTTSSPSLSWLRHLLSGSWSHVRFCCPQIGPRRRTGLSKLMHPRRNRRKRAHLLSSGSEVRIPSLKFWSISLM